MAYCMEFVRSTPHTYALNIGDLSNNWIGHLQRLYAHQHTTDDEAIKLVEVVQGDREVDMVGSKA